MHDFVIEWHKRPSVEWVANDLTVQAKPTAICRVPFSEEAIARHFKRAGARAARRPQKKWRSPRGLRHSCSSIITYGHKTVREQMHRSVHPLDSAARVATSRRAPSMAS